MLLGHKFPRGNAGESPPHEAIASAQWKAPDLVASYLEYDENEQTQSPFLFGKYDQVDAVNVLPVYLKYDDDAHIVTIAGSRAGKGVSLVVPNLLSYKGSIICVDLKGENAEITADYRRDILGQDVIVLDPFNSTRFETLSFNPLQDMNKDSKTLIDDIGDLAEAFIVRTDEKSAHWDESAKSVIKMILLYIVFEHEEAHKNLSFLREYLLKGVPDKDGKESFENFLKLAFSHDNGFVSGMAGRLLMMGDNEKGSVLSTVHRNTEFLDSSSIQDVIKTSDFDLSSLRSETGASIYLVMPEKRLAQQTRWLRLLITVFLHHLQTDLKKNASDPSVLFVLDEFSSLGYMQVIERASGYIAGFGVKIWSILQDLSQLKDIYPRRWETFLGNAGIITAFGNNDLTTLDYLSKRIGQCEVSRVEQNITQGKSQNRNMSSLYQKIRNPLLLFGSGGSEGATEGASYQPKKIISPLLLPDEIGKEFSKQSEKILVLIAGSYPIFAQRVLYYEDQLFEGRYKNNPYV